MKTHPRSVQLRRNRSKLGPLPCALMAIAALLNARSTQAASGTWNGTTDGNWNSTTNWSVNPAPGSTTVTNSADTATFNNAGNTNTTVTIDANRNIKSITFDTGTTSYTIGSAGANGGNTLLLTSAGAITLAATAAGTNLIETFNAALTLGGSYSFSNNRADAGSALVFAGNISNSATSTLTLGGSGTGTGNQISGAISDGIGVQSVTFSGTAGKWTLSGSNSYSGLTSITGSGSTTVLAGSNSSAGATTLNNSNATLQLASASNGGLASGLLTLTAGKLEALNAERSISNAITLTAVTVQGSQNLNFNGKLTGLTGGARTLTSSITGGGTLTLSDIDINTETANARTLTIAGTGNTKVTGTIANGNGTTANGLTITNTGTTTLSGTSTYTGATTISTAGSTVNLSGALGNTAVTVGNATATLNLQGVNALNGSASLTVNSGTVNLTKSNSYSGATLLSGGNVNLSDKGAFGSSVVTMNATTLSATTDLSGAQAIANSIGTTSSGGITIFTGSNNLEFSGTNSANVSHTFTNNISGGTLTFSGTQNLSTSASNFTLTVNGSGNTAISGVISNGAGGATGAGLTFTGSGMLTLSGANSYGGTTSVGSSTVTAGTLLVTGAGTLGSGAVSVLAGTLSIEGTKTLGSTLTMGGGAVGSTGSISIATGGVLNFGGNLTFSSTNNANGATISGGTVNLGGARTFTIGDSTNAAVDLTVSSLIGDGNGIFDVTKSGTGTMAYTRNIDLTTLTTTTPTANVTGGVLQLDGAITGANGIFSVIKAGAGTLNYTANFALTANQTATVAGGAGILQLSGVISGSGFGLTVNDPGSGVLLLTGQNTYTGATIVNSGGTLKIGGAAGSVAASDVTVSDGSVLNFDSSTSGVTGTTRAGNVKLTGTTLSGAALNSLTVTGNAGSNSVDSISGTLTFGYGFSAVTLTPNAATNTRLNIANATRDAGGIVLYRGTNLGVNAIASATAGATNISFTNAPAMLGAGAAAGQTNVSIIPGAYGDTSASGSGSAITTGGLVTYDTTYGVRLLDTTNEYTTTISDGQTRLDNIRFARTSGSASQDVTLTAALTTINSLSFRITGAGTNSGVTIGSNAGSVLKINSGMIYANQGVTTAASSDAMTINVSKLDLNGQEGTFIVFSAGSNNGNTPAPLQINSEITNDGGNGITIAGTGQVVFGGTVANTYTGVTTINSGVLRLGKTGVNGLTGDLVMNGGTLLKNSNSIADTASVTINAGTFWFDTTTSSGNNNNSETVNNFTMNGGAVGNHGSNASFTINGNATLNASQLGMNQGGDITVLGLTTLNGGLLIAKESSSTTAFTGNTSLNNVEIFSQASGAYTAITLNANATNKGALLLLNGNLTFTGNGTNTNTTLIDSSDTGLANQGFIALNGNRSFNVGNGAAAVDLKIVPALIDNGGTAGGLSKTGQGTLELGGANTYTGATSVDAGTLVVSGSLSGTSSVAVAAGSTLATGSATNIATAANGNLSVSGTLAPGGTTGTGALTLNLGASAKLSFQSGSILDVDLTLDPLSSDRVQFASSGDWLGGSGLATLSLDGSIDYTATYTIFQNVSTSGFAFNNISGYDVAHYQAVFQQSGADYQLSFVAIPEPSSFVTLMSGIAMLGCARRFRRAVRR